MPRSSCEGGLDVCRRLNNLWIHFRIYLTYLRSGTQRWGHERQITTKKKGLETKELMGFESEGENGEKKSCGPLLQQSPLRCPWARHSTCNFSCELLSSHVAVWMLKKQRILAQQNNPPSPQNKTWLRTWYLVPDNEACSSSSLLSVCWFECVCLFWFSRMQSLYLFVSSLSNIYELISQICRGLWGWNQQT